MASDAACRNRRSSAGPAKPAPRWNRSRRWVVRVVPGDPGQAGLGERSPVRLPILRARLGGMTGLRPPRANWPPSPAGAITCRPWPCGSGRPARNSSQILRSPHEARRSAPGGLAPGPTGTHTSIGRPRFRPWRSPDVACDTPPGTTGGLLGNFRSSSSACRSKDSLKCPPLTVDCVRTAARLSARRRFSRSRSLGRWSLALPAPATAAD